MIRALPVLLGLALITPVAFAQELPPPRNPAGNAPEPQQQGPVLVAPPPAPVPPQNAQQQPPPAPPGAQAPNKKEKLRAVLAALRQAENDRKQARIDRMNQFKAARAAEEQKLYQDWHERYLADAPVRVEYYRALTAAYQSQPATYYGSPYYFGSPYYYGAGPAVILPPVYGPIIATPVCGTFFSCGW
jgi:hypothetical protein